MSARSAHRARREGFTLLEIVVVIGVLVMLSALLVPAIGSVLDDAKVAEAASMFKTLKTACSKHHFDTGRFAREYAGERYVASKHHHLATEQSYKGWKGPYLEEPLDLKHNPWKGDIRLYDELLVKGLKGWDLDRDGTYELKTQEDACVLFMDNVAESGAEELDAELDTTTAKGGDWRMSGRIQFQDGSLWMLVLRQN